MAYIVDISEREETDLFNLTPSSGASLGAAVRGTFGENASTLIYQAGQLRQANAVDMPRLPREDAEARVKAAGVKLAIPEDGYTAEALDLLIKRQKDAAALRAVQERTPWSWIGSPVRGAASLLTGVVDPLNVASAFIPVVREQRAAAMLARAGEGFLARAATRAQIGAVEGVAGAALLEPLVAGLHTQLQDDYGMADSLVNLAFGGLLGGGLHSSVGALADFKAPKVRLGDVVEADVPPLVDRTSAPGSAAATVADTSPELREMTMRGAVADMAQGRTPEVERLLTVDRAENFRAWFGQSRVVDEAGAPRVVYHGTAADVEAFDAARSGRNYEGGGDRGFFFTSKPATAGRYAEQAAAPGREPEGAPNVMPVYLSLQRPLVRETSGAGLNDAPDKWFDANKDALYAEADRAGADGIVIRGAGQWEGRDVYVAFRPEQVKSAIGNSGLFDPNSPSLTDTVRTMVDQRSARQSAVAEPGSAAAADQRLAHAPKDQNLEAAQAELDAAATRLDDLQRSLEAQGVPRETTARIGEALKPFDEAIADAKRMGNAVRELATCGTMT
jgi:hypothetical protein